MKNSAPQSSRNRLAAERLYSFAAKLLTVACKPVIDKNHVIHVAAIHFLSHLYRPFSNTFPDQYMRTKGKSCTKEDNGIPFVPQMLDKFFCLQYDME